MIAQLDAGLLSHLIPLLAGPGAAVIVLVGVLYALYTMAVKHAMPLAGTLAKRHLDQIDTLIATQKAESVAITKTLSSIDRRLARLEGLTDAGQFSGNPGALSPDRST